MIRNSAIGTILAVRRPSVARPALPALPALLALLALAGSGRGFVDVPEPSVLEAHMHRLIGVTGLTPPAAELHFGEDCPYRLDLAWAAIRLAIEIDGWVHFTPEQKARHEARRNDLRQGGWTALVYNWRQVLREPDHISRMIMETFRRLSRPG